MKRTDPQPLGDLLRKAIEETRSAPLLAETQAIAAWPVVIGTEIASLTSKPFVSKRVMTIRVPAAPLRQELNMMRSALARAINAEVGKDVIDEIRFRG